MKHQRGITLVITLLLLFTLTLLALSAITTSQLQLHMSHNLSDTLHEFQATESVLNKIEEEIAAQGTIKSCLYSPIDKEQGKKPWLESTYPSCLQEQTGIKIHYIVEAFTAEADEICILPAEKIGRYYRITAWPEVNNRNSTILQTTYAAVAVQEPCEEKMQQVKAGRLSWCELSG